MEDTVIEAAYTELQTKHEQWLLNLEEAKKYQKYSDEYDVDAKRLAKYMQELGVYVTKTTRKEHDHAVARMLTCRNDAARFLRIANAQRENLLRWLNEGNRDLISRKYKIPTDLESLSTGPAITSFAVGM